MASGNGISGLLSFKILWGSMPPNPSRDWRLQRAPGLPPRTQISSYGHDLPKLSIVSSHNENTIETSWKRAHAFVLSEMRPCCSLVSARHLMFRVVFVLSWYVYSGLGVNVSVMRARLATTTCRLIRQSRPECYEVLHGVMKAVRSGKSRITCQPWKWETLFISVCISFSNTKPTPTPIPCLYPDITTPR